MVRNFRLTARIGGSTNTKSSQIMVTRSMNRYVFCINFIDFSSANISKAQNYTVNFFYFFTFVLHFFCYCFYYLIIMSYVSFTLLEKKNTCAKKIQINLCRFFYPCFSLTHDILQKNVKVFWRKKVSHNKNVYWFLAILGLVYFVRKSFFVKSVAEWCKIFWLFILWYLSVYFNCLDIWKIEQKTVKRRQKYLRKNAQNVLI